jgi:hypothetical protein
VQCQKTAIRHCTHISEGSNVVIQWSQRRN